ncbi:hypothetical protein A2U01_0059478 [Trifolium medium]|uniref:Uncharacterized protein n=1 Tax=Trifolium medium TaxID=97028 RepID=A0A392RR41_9FABA|nr:hypothetical protein [Trifolium medium]
MIIADQSFDLLGGGLCLIFFRQFMASQVDASSSFMSIGKPASLIAVEGG